MVNSMERVGSSTETRSSGLGCSGWQTVSPISGSGKPVSATISPAVAFSASLRPSLSNSCKFTISPATWLPPPLRTTTLSPHGHFAAIDAADGDPPDIFRPTDGGDHHLKRRVRIDFRSRNIVDHHVQNGMNRFGPLIGIVCGISFAGAGVDVREIQRFVVGTEFHQQVKHLRQHFVGTAVGTVDLVDHYHRLQARTPRPC